jgi:hypothetical protein
VRTGIDTAISDAPPKNDAVVVERCGAAHPRLSDGNDEPILKKFGVKN